MTRGFKWRPGSLATNTAYTTGWAILRACLQAASLLLLARHFGSSGYGALVGAVALYSTVGQIVGLGSGVALVRTVSRQPHLLPGHLAATRRAYFYSGIAAFVLVWPASTLILPSSMSPALLAALAAAEMIAAPSLMPTVYALQGQERMGFFGLSLAIAPIARLAAIVVCMVIQTSDLALYAASYLLALSAAAVVTSAVAFRHSQPLPEVSVASAVRGGLSYAVMGTAATAGNELDKTVMLRLIGADATGHYAAPFRILQAAVLPAVSLALAATPRLFRRHGEGGPSLRVAHLAVATLAYSVLACGALYLASSYLPVLLGPDFTESGPILVSLLPYFILTCQRQVLGPALTSTDLQWSRNFIEVASVVMLLVLLSFSVPRYGIPGAVFSLTLVELGYVVTAAALYATRGRSKA